MWYLPENARGIGTAEDQFHKTAATAPGGEASYCTYIEILGKYTTADAKEREISYTLFLGADNVRDYNLLRGREYNISTVLRGINLADTRVKDLTIYGVDYTDIHKPWFTVGEVDDGYTTWKKWMVGTGPGTDGSKCPAGWRMPTQKDWMLLWIYNPGLGTAFRGSSVYFSADKYGGYADAVWCLDIRYGRMYEVGDGTTNQIRCIRDLQW